MTEKAHLLLRVNVGKLLALQQLLKGGSVKPPVLVSEVQQWM
jgi:hypothetical protein